MELSTEITSREDECDRSAYVGEGHASWELEHCNYQLCTQYPLFCASHYNAKESATI